MRYDPYQASMGNIAQLAVSVANDGSALGLLGVDAELFLEHGVTPPSDDEVEELLGPLRDALGVVADGTVELEPVNLLLRQYPPRLHISAHDGTPHLHHAENAEPGLVWLGRCCAAAIAHVATGVPEVTIGRCQASDCPNFFVDRSKNRSRRFCSNTCASRTTVAAYRSRLKDR